MLVERELGIAAVVIVEIGAEPVREVAVEVLNALAELTAEKSGSTLSRAVGNNYGKALVSGSGPECCLSEA